MRYHGMGLAMKDWLLRRQAVEERTGLSTATIYRKMKGGTFPLARRIGERAVRWSEAEIEEWIAGRPLAMAAAA